ncbi:hypothetical protein PMAYCL1PPCAC_25520, partial [Pristionchus mayeri]
RCSIMNSNELLKHSAAQIKEKNDELASLRENSQKELEAVRKEKEESNGVLLKELLVSNEKMVKLGESHADTMVKLNEKHNEEKMEMHHEIIAAHRETHETTVKMLMSRSETTAITLGIFNNVIAKNAIEKDAANVNSKICNIRQALYRMEDGIRKIIIWKVENGLKKYDKSLKALISRLFSHNEKNIEMYLNSLSEECSQIGSLIRDVVELVSNGAFEKDLKQEAKGVISFGLGKVSDLFDEIAK